MKKTRKTPSSKIYPLFGCEMCGSDDDVKVVLTEQQPNHEVVWLKRQPLLCIPCCEKVLGRPLRPGDTEFVMRSGKAAADYRHAKEQ